MGQGVMIGQMYIMEHTGKFDTDHFTHEPITKYANEEGSWWITTKKYESLGKPNKIIVDTTKPRFEERAYK